MSFAKRHNQASAQFDYELQDHHDFMSLADIKGNYGIDEVHAVRMLYINKHGHYGDAPAIVTDDHIVNAPQHLLATVKDVLNDAESVNMINKGLVGFKLYEYENKFGKQLSIEWVDIEPDEDEPEEQPKKIGKPSDRKKQTGKK